MKFILRKSTNKLNKIKLKKKTKTKNDIPDFMSTLSTFPYLLKSLSTSDWRASKSRFPQKTGLIFPSAKSKLRNLFARDLQSNARKNQVIIAYQNRWNRRKILGLDGSQVEEEGSEVDLTLGGRMVPSRKGGGFAIETLGVRLGVLRYKRERVRESWKVKSEEKKVIFTSNHTATWHEVPRVLKRTFKHFMF